MHVPVPPPSMLHNESSKRVKVLTGARYRVRTYDPIRVKDVLYH